MVLQRYESWIIWVVVDLVYTYQYWNGENYLTAILYFIFTLIAVAGWKRWRRESAISKA
jgi:nicotinamide mononucleotide transporter